MKRNNYPKHRKAACFNEICFMGESENPLLTCEQDLINYRRLIKLILKYHKGYSKVLLGLGSEKFKRKNAEFSGLLEWIRSKTPILQTADFDVEVKTMCYWVIHGMSDFPKCKLAECNHKVMEHSNIKSLHLGYRDYCSIRCINKDEAVRNKISDTTFARTGYRNTSQDPAIKEKKRVRAQEVYGVDNVFQAESVKETVRSTNRRNYGCDYPRSNIEFQRECEDKIELKYGVRNVAKVRKFIVAGINTKIRNGTSNRSKPEDSAYELLCRIYGNQSVLRNYNGDPRYPFQCDFVIPSADLFIECNFHWTHGLHWFNENDPKDAEKLSIWRRKTESAIGVNYYASAINVWTVRDPLKRKIAEQNSLNYLVFWTYAEFQEWYEKQSAV